MRYQTPLIVGAIFAVGVVSLPTASAAVPAGFSKTRTFVDQTPDPTAFFLGPEHCKGRLPAEKPVAVNIPGSGTVTVAISGFTGEWSLMITDAAGRVIATADATPPKTEANSFKMKRAGKINILPCNLAGSFEAKLVYSYRYKKV